LIPLAVGVACAELIEGNPGLPVVLKWPNDLILSGKKVGGILVRRVVGIKGKGSALLVGIGINITSRLDDFPVALRSKITTFAQHGREVIDFEGYLRQMSAGVTRMLNLLDKRPEKVVASWRGRDYCKDKSLTWQNGGEMVQGIGLGLLDNGCYRLRDKEGRVHEMVGGSLFVSDGNPVPSG